MLILPRLSSSGNSELRVRPEDKSRLIERTTMADRHQINSIIAAAICDAGNDHPGHRMDPEEAKQIAKCIIEALTDAGLQIVPVRQD